MVYSPPQGTYDPRLDGVLSVIPSAPGIVEPDTSQDLSLSISTIEGIPTAANLIAGAITITRVRAGVEVVVVASAACVVTDGRIYYNYTFSSASWQTGDEYKVVFSGQTVIINAMTCALSDIRCKGVAIDTTLIVAAAQGKPNVQDVVIYPVAEDAGVTELVDAGASPAFYPTVAASTNVVGEGAAVAAWSEDIDFEQQGTITIISIYAEFEWQTRFLIGAGNGVNSVSKIQISRDGGVNWVDLTDNFINPLAVMTTQNREGVGLWIPTVVAGANKLMFRLLHWVDVGTGVSTSECQIRSNSFIRITYRKG